MWFLTFLPSWFFHAIPIAGVLAIFASIFLKAIPFVSTYYQPLRIVGVTVLLIGIFFEGALYNNNAWELRVKEMEAKMAEINAQSQKENVKIVEKVVTRTQIVKERGLTLVNSIDSAIKKYDNTCIVPKEFVEIHNKAAEQPK